MPTFIRYVQAIFNNRSQETNLGLIFTPYVPDTHIASQLNSHSSILGNLS